MMFNANLFLNQAVEWTGSNVLLSCQWNCSVFQWTTS